MTSVRATSNNTAATGTAVSVAAPTGTTDGDVVLVCVHCNNATTIVDNNGSTSFTEDVNDYQEVTAGLTASLFSRRIQSGDPSTYNFTIGSSTRWTAIAVCLQSPHSSDIYDVTSSNTQQAAGIDAVIDAADITTLTANAIHCIFAGADGASNAFDDPPAGYTSPQNTGNQSLIFSYLVIASPGATGAVALGFTTVNAAFAFSFAIKDHTAGGGGAALGIAPLVQNYRNMGLMQ